MSVNMSYALIMMVIGLAMQLCAILEAASITQDDVKVLIEFLFTFQMDACFAHFT